MTLGLRIRLSLMMFLEFFVWGAWYTVGYGYMTDPGSKGGLGFSDATASTIFGLLPVASIFMPLLAGQITDRKMPTQVFLGIVHLLGGLGMFLAANSRDESPFYYGILIWALAYAPTISLTNSLAFSHVKDAERDFGPIRVFGTIGWIVAGLVLSAWRYSRPEVAAGLGRNDCFYLGGAAGLLMGLFCFTLPHTPPARAGVSPWAFLKALALLKNPRIAVFLLISFVVAIEFPFYFQFTDQFLQSIGADAKSTPALLVIAQVAEILTMLALPLILKKYGPRKTLFIGVMAWPVRYLIFAMGKPYGLVVASLALHGICFVFFFVVAFIYIDSVAPKDIKASAQGLLTLIVYGFGMWVGSHFAGMI